MHLTPAAEAVRHYVIVVEIQLFADTAFERQVVHLELMALLLRLLGMLWLGLLSLLGVFV